MRQFDPDSDSDTDPEEDYTAGSELFWTSVIKDMLYDARNTHPLARKILSIPLESLEKSLLSIPGISFADLPTRGRGKVALRNTASCRPANGGSAGELLISI